MKSGSLNLLESIGLVRVCNGIPSLYPTIKICQLLIRFAKEDDIPIGSAVQL
jgi:hypothetical protein